MHKRWINGKVPPTVLNQANTKDPANLCVVKTLGEYFSRTEGWRSGEECSKLLLSFVNPDKPVVYSLISGVVKNVLRKAGVDIGTFRAHSNRSTYLSKIDLTGTPIEEILKRGCWSSKCIWQMFYNKKSYLRG